jgi:hypothetical protein
MKNIILLSCLVAIFFSCEQKLKQEENSTYKFQSIEVPIKCNFNLKYSKYLISDSSIIGFNKQSNSIQEIYFDDVYKNTELHLFENEGPNSTISPSIFTFSKGQFILIDIQNNIRKLDLRSKEIEMKTLSLGNNGVDFGLHNGVVVNPPKYYSTYKDQLLFPVYKLIPRNTADYYDSLYFVELNLSSLDYEIKRFKMPEEFKVNKWPTHDSFSVLKLDQNKYIFSFEAFSDLFSNSKNGTLKRQKINLVDYNIKNYVESFSSLDNQILAYRNRKYTYGSQRFFPLKFNQGNNAFYRIIKGETNGESTTASEKLYLFKWDKNFEYMGSIQLPAGILADFSIHNGALCFQQSEKYAKSEDMFRLMKFTDF